MKFHICSFDCTLINTHKRRVRTTLPRPSEANFSSKYHQDCAPSFCHRPFNVLPPTENRHVKDDAPYRRSGQSVWPRMRNKAHEHRVTDLYSFAGSNSFAADSFNDMCLQDHLRHASRRVAVHARPRESTPAGCAVLCAPRWTL